MTILPHSLLVAAQPSRRWSAFARYAVSVASVLADAVVIVGLCVAVGWVYHRVVYGECRAAAQLRQCRVHGGGPVRAAGHRPRRIRPDALPRLQAAPAARVHLLERHLRHAARARVPDAGDGGVLARLDAAVLRDRPAGDRPHPLRAGLDRDPRQQGRTGHRAARVPDRQRRGHQRLRAALSAVEFRAAHRRRGAVDAARRRPRRREERRAGARRRSAPGDRHRAHAAARCGLYRVAVVRDRHDRQLRRRVPQHPGRDPSRPRAHSRPLRECAHRQARPDGEPAAHARAAQLVRADAEAPARRDGRGRRAGRALAAARRRGAADPGSRAGGRCSSASAATASTSRNSASSSSAP